MGGWQRGVHGRQGAGTSLEKLNKIDLYLFLFVPVPNPCFRLFLLVPSLYHLLYITNHCPKTMKIDLEVNLQKATVPALGM